MNTYPVSIQHTQLLQTEARQQLNPALTVSSRKRPAILQLTMGIALLVLALLQVAASPDFILVSGALVTTWVAVTVFRQLQ